MKNTHIVLLRGINVSGKNKIKMAELRAALAAHGFERVQTYIQSGNIVFCSDENRESVCAQIAKIIYNKWQYTVMVIGVSAAELKESLALNPFGLESAKNKTTYFGYLKSTPEPSNIAALQSISYPPETVKFQNGFLFLHSPHGAGKAKITHKLLERKLAVGVTIRNYNTVSRLIAIAEEM